jgi:3-methyladenine DNA glycosylase/8-oxoguanine DNA glycosylase
MSTLPDVSFTIATLGPLDLPRTVAPVRHGLGDPSMRIGPNGVWRATRTSAGPLTLQLHLRGESLTIAAWGPGAALASSIGPRLAGQEDDPAALVPRHRLIRDLARRHVGLRLAATGNAWEALAPAIIEQKVTGTEAFRAWRLLLIAHGERAPGPPGLVLPPTASAIAGLPYHAFHQFGIERRRADTLRRAAALGDRLEALTDPAAAQRTLSPIFGIGPWTIAEVNRVAFGDADAVSVGDFHVPNLVSWALAGEPRGDDARMLELLEPYRGQRGRVQRLLEASGLRAPRYGPRLAPRSIAAI